MNNPKDELIPIEGERNLYYAKGTEPETGKVSRGFVIAIICIKNGNVMTVGRVRKYHFEDERQEAWELLAQGVGPYAVMSHSHVAHAQC